jgi:osmotically-inducible protein OsmY
MTRNFLTIGAPLALLLGSAAFGQSSDHPNADNTGVNKQDRQTGGVTADQQAMNKQDRELTAKIRKSVVADKSLSTYAHNIKVISQNGTDTLKGPVRSDDEIRAILAKASEATGDANKVVNELTLAPEKH